MSLPAYTKNVRLLLDVWTTKSKTLAGLSELASILGCRYTRQGYSVVGPRMIEPGETTTDDVCPGYEAVTLQALLEMLDVFDPTSWMAEHIAPVIMDGLLRNGRWQTCLLSEAGAYAFAALAVHLHERVTAIKSRTSMSGELYRVVMEDLWSTLVEWLGDPSKEGAYRSRDLAAAMFGETWCALIVDEDATFDSVYTFILRLRPTFKEGLAPDLPRPSAEDLPVLDCG